MYDCGSTCVFQQSLGCVGSIDDLHQVWQDHAHVRLHLCTCRHTAEKEHIIKCLRKTGHLQCGSVVVANATVFTLKNMNAEYEYRNHLYE